MLVVAGLSLKNLHPRVWDSKSPYFLPHLQAIMVSYANFHCRPRLREQVMEQGLHEYLGVPSHLKIYLDNGAFYFLTRQGETPPEAYEEFVARARPDWWPIPQDFIPTPAMTPEEQRSCLARTMENNLAYQHDGFVPVIHIGRLLDEYVVAVQTSERLAAKPAIALGGIVPNLLRAPKALPYADILRSLREVRAAFHDKTIHVYGIGGTATLHLTAVLGFDSVDSSGWRNRAARGLVQLPGGGDRSIADLGKWRGRKPDDAEWQRLRHCQCTACAKSGLDGLTAGGIAGFSNRAVHNLWVLLEEAQAIGEKLGQGTYTHWYTTHLDNTIYRPLIDGAVALMANTPDL